MSKKLFTEEQNQFIKHNAKGINTQTLTELFNLKFGTAFKISQIEGYKHRNHICDGIDSRFKKGNIPFNKGNKGCHYPGSEKSWFKKGHVPQSHKPVGAETLRSDGYVYIKVAEPNSWKFKHKVVWEKHYGPIPKNHIVTFLNKNTTDIRIENLKLIPKSLNLLMNQNNYYNKNSTITEVNITRAEIKAKIFKIKKERNKNNEK